MKSWEVRNELHDFLAHAAVALEALELATESLNSVLWECESDSPETVAEKRRCEAQLASLRDRAIVALNGKCDFECSIAALLADVKVMRDANQVSLLKEELLEGRHRAERERRVRSAN